MFDVVRISSCWVVFVALLVGCQNPPHTPSDPLFDSAPNTRAASAPRPTPKTGPLRWQRVQFEEGMLTLDIPAGQHRTHPWDVGGVLTHNVRLDSDHFISVTVRASEGENLDSLRLDYPGNDNTFSEVTRTRACGQQASRVMITRPEKHYECIEFIDRPSAPGWTPAQTTIAQHFKHGALDVIARWEVPSQLRARYRADEKRFFASFNCSANDTN